MALALKQPGNIVEDMGTDDFIRAVREMWIQYANPKFIDLLDTNRNPTPDEEMIDPVLKIILPEIVPFKPDRFDTEEQ